MNEEREIIFGGYNARGEWVEGSACKNDDNTDWLIIGPFMAEETCVAHVGTVYQYTGIDINGQEVFEGSRITGGYQWVDSSGHAQSEDVDTTVEFYHGGWVLSSTKESLYELVNNDCLYWDAKVTLPEE